MYKTHKNTSSEGKTAYFKAFSRVFIIVLILSLTQITMVYAFEFDDRQYYNEITKEVTIKNFWGLGQDNAKIKLNTPINNVVPIGYTKVFQVTIESYDDYKNFIRAYEFEDLNKNKEKINRDIDLKYLTIEEFLVEEHAEVCPKERPQDMIVCPQEKTGNSWYETREVWNDFNNEEFLTKGNITIGGFTNVLKGDNVEWYIDFGGSGFVREWATWSGGVVDVFACYTFNESSGDLIDWVDGSLNMTNNGAGYSQAGKLGTSFLLDDTDPDYLTVADSPELDTINTEMAISVWVNFGDDGDSGFILSRDDNNNRDWLLYRNTDNKIYFLVWEGGALVDVVSDGTHTLGSWVHVVVGVNSSVTYMYINNAIQADAHATAAAIDKDTVAMEIGRRSDGDHYYAGYIDELAIWNRTITPAEIGELYNSGNAITCADILTVAGATPDTTNPEVFLTIPTNASSTSNSTITFNWTVTDDVNVSNSTLYVNGLLNATYPFGTGNETTFQVTMSTLADGSYNWTATAYDNSSNQGTNNTWFFTIDAIPPLVSLTELGSISTHVIGTNLTINYTVTGGSTCLLEYDGVNRTITCGDTGTYINTTKYDEKSLILWANDTGGNTNVSTISWNYDYWENNITFTTPVTEGDTSLFTVDFIYNDTKYPTSVTGNLSYGGVQTYASTIGGTGSNRTLNNSLTAPSVAAVTNYTFYWVVDLNNGTSNLFNSSSNIQVVNNVAIGTCAAYNNTLLNFTVVDEVSQTSINATLYNLTVEIEGELSLFGETAVFMNFSETFDDTNPAEICMANPLNNSQYTLTTLVRYDGDGYAGEFYNIQNTTISNDTIPLEITLYDLEDSRAQIFEIEYKDENFRPVKDAIIQIQRKYIDEGVFKTVEIPKTDFRGLAPANFELDNVVYTLIVSKYGQTLLTQEDVIATCQNPSITTCSISLNSYSTSSDPEDFTVLDDFTFTISYDEDTRDVETIFTIPSGVSQAVLLNTTLFDGLGKTQVCSDSLTSSSGTLNCIIPANYGNGTVVSTITKAGDFQGRAFIKLEQEPEDIYGANLVFVGMFLILSIVGVGVVSSPIIMAIFLILGVVGLVVLNLIDTPGLIGAGATALWIIIAIIVIIIKGVNRE